MWNTKSKPKAMSLKNVASILSNKTYAAKKRKHILSEEHW